MNNTILTKLEHSSILLNHKGKNILFDPGNFSKQNNNLHNIDILLITHSHGDHLNLENIKYVHEHTNNLQIITNSEVAGQIKDLKIKTHIIENTNSINIDNVFFHPGDAFTKPNKAISAIATVIVAPFMRIKWL